jgi:arginase family enzyme
MKKLLAICALFLSIQLVQAAPDSEKESKKDKNEMTEAQKIRAEEMKERLDEIKALDFKSMSKDEIKEVRMELKEMKEEAKAEGKGIYLSIGAIIIIILLLILLL